MTPTFRNRVAAAWQQRNIRVAVWVILGIGVVSLIGYFAGRSRGKGDQTPYQKGESVPDPFVKEVAPQVLSMLNTAFAGYSIDISQKRKALEMLLPITDGQLRYLSNEYNHQYFAGSTQTLLQLIADEFVGFWYEPTVKVKEKVLARMRSLDIR